MPVAYPSLLLKDEQFGFGALKTQEAVNMIRASNG